MKLRLYALLASSSILAITTTMPVHAAKAASTSQQIAADSDATEEIVVTARRKEENLQDVPESVNAVSGQTLQKFNITQFQDVQKLIPGLIITPQTGYNGGGGTSRGLSFGPGSNPSSLQIYVNDGAIDQYFAYMSMYDIGDIESLNGPQGTIRGRMADTGAITITTRRPDMEKVGGYAEATQGSLRDNNFQGAVSLPIIQDKLAIRISAIRDENASNDVKSINDFELPVRTRDGARVTTRFTPTDDLDVVLSYAHNRQVERDYGTIYYGPGNAISQPLAASQRLSIEGGLAHDTVSLNDFEGTLNWTFHGQKLTAVSAYSRYHTNACNDGNPTDQITGVKDYEICTPTFRKEFNQDIRLSSAEPLIHGYLDYVVGFFYDRNTTLVVTPQNLGYLPGAFVGGQVNYADIINTNLTLPQDQDERAYYANLTVHITPKDNLLGGVRYGAEQHNISAPITGGHALGSPDIATYHPVIYNFEFDHHFNDDLMVYARTASTWRYGTINPVLLLTISGPSTPLFHNFIFPAPPEQSKEYEAGIKGDAFDKRVTYSVDYYHQVYSNFIGFGGTSVWHLATATGALIAQYSAFGLPGVPAKVDGIEGNASVKIMKNWNLDGSISWDNAKISGNLPCNPAGVAAPPTGTAAQALAALGTTVVNLCPGTAPTTNTPKWHANLSSEFDQPINDAVNGYVRGLFNYTPRNPNTGNPAYIAPAYATLDLYLGVRSPTSAWDVALYGKNITNNSTMLTSSVVNPVSPGTKGQIPGSFTLLGLGFTGANSAGYNTATLVPPREFGITVHYAFGSR